MSSINKSTHTSFKTELFAPVIKNTKGKYIAVLTDTSVDRDDERMGKEALYKISKDTGYLTGLLDHENKALGQVCKWINRKIIKIDGSVALVAEPKFFLDNPKAQIIKRMLDDGAQFGISISTIVKDYIDEKVNNKSCRTFLDTELLEASFCGIPSCRSGQAMAIAKSFDMKIKNKEIKLKMEKTHTQQDVDSAVSDIIKKFESEVSDFKKQLENKNTEVSGLNKKLVAKIDEISNLDKKLTEKGTEVSDVTKRLESEVSDVTKKFESEILSFEKRLDEKDAFIKSLQTQITGCKEDEGKAKENEDKVKIELEKEKKLSLEKMKLATVSDIPDGEEFSETNFQKNIKEGKLPIMRFKRE